MSPGSALGGYNIRSSEVRNLKQRWHVGIPTGSRIYDKNNNKIISCNYSHIERFYLVDAARQLTSYCVTPHETKGFYKTLKYLYIHWQATIACQHQSPLCEKVWNRIGQCLSFDSSTWIRGWGIQNKKECKDTHHILL